MVVSNAGSEQTTDPVLLKRRFVEFLVESDTIEFDPKTFPSWVTQGFFIKFGRALATGRRLKTLADYYHQLILGNVREEPDYVFGPAYKGIPIAALTATLMGETRPVGMGFDLPGEVRISVNDVLSRYVQDVKEVRQIRVPLLSNSRELQDWARKEAELLYERFEPLQKSPSNFGFNTIVADGSAIPPAAALAAALVNYSTRDRDVNPDFAIPRRAKQYMNGADHVYRERTKLHSDESMLRREAAERMVVGRVRDHARYILVSPFKDEPMQNRPYIFGEPEKSHKTGIIVDDSILTGETVNKWHHELGLRYPNMRVLGGFFAVHIQELVPNIRGDKKDIKPFSEDVRRRLPLRAVIDSGDILHYLHKVGKMAEDVYAAYTDATRRYGTAERLA